MDAKEAVREFIAEARRNVKLREQQQKLLEQSKKAIHKEIAKEWKTKLKTQ